MFLKRLFSNLWLFLNLSIKSLVDVIGSIILILLLLPLMFIISILIKSTSKGPIIFKQNRLTKNLKIFRIYKFRTMVENAEYIGTGLFNYDGDYRVTKIGRFLRRTSLDELPQLFNILTLRMSFVGPRPPVEYELGDLYNLSKEYKDRFRMRAGVTGLAQISGRNEIDWDMKIKLDNKYINNFKKIGFLYDIYLVLVTFIKVFKKDNINEIEPSYLKDLSPDEKKKIMMNEVFKKAKGNNEK